MHRYLLFVVCCLISSIRAQDDNIVVDHELTDDNPVYIWTKSNQEQILRIVAEEGYDIQVNISLLNLNGDNGDYISIIIDNDENELDNGVMYSYILSEMYHLFNYHQLLCVYSYNADDEDTNEFIVQFSRVGEALTTTMEPTTVTTVKPLPTPAPNENDTLTVYLQGKKITDYVIEDVQEAIKNMGTDYCNVQNCPLEDPIETSNVKIVLLETCPINWDHSNVCANLTFGLPIIKSTTELTQSSIWNGYQLNTKHLEQMWKTYAKKYLNEIDLAIYEVPNVHTILTRELVIFCMITVTLVGIILIFRYVIRRINRGRQKHNENYAKMDEPSLRTSVNNLEPHYLQEFPPFITNEFPMYSEKRDNIIPVVKVEHVDDDDMFDIHHVNVMNISEDDQNVDTMA